MLAAARAGAGKAVLCLLLGVASLMCMGSSFLTMLLLLAIACVLTWRMQGRCLDAAPACTAGCHQAWARLLRHPGKLSACRLPAELMRCPCTLHMLSLGCMLTPGAGAGRYPAPHFCAVCE